MIGDRARPPERCALPVEAAGGVGGGGGGRGQANLIERPLCSMNAAANARVSRRSEPRREPPNAKKPAAAFIRIAILKPRHHVRVPRFFL